MARKKTKVEDVMETTVGTAVAEAPTSKELTKDEMVAELMKLGFEWEETDNPGDVPDAILLGYGDATVFEYLKDKRKELEDGFQIMGSFWDDDCYVGIHLKDLNPKSYAKLLQVTFDVQRLQLGGATEKK